MATPHPNKSVSSARGEQRARTDARIGWSPDHTRRALFGPSSPDAVNQGRRPLGTPRTLRLCLEPDWDAPFESEFWQLSASARLHGRPEAYWRIRRIGDGLRAGNRDSLGVSHRVVGHVADALDLIDRRGPSKANDAFVRTKSALPVDPVEHLGREQNTGEDAASA